jgi:hypothetical protein
MRKLTIGITGTYFDRTGISDCINVMTGEAMQTIDYVPGRGNLNDWGDKRGNRSDRFFGLRCLSRRYPS